MRPPKNEPRPLPRYVWSLLVAVSVVLLAASLHRGLSSRPADERTPDGRLVVEYWEKWSGFEAENMKVIVDDFNASQDRLHVRMLSIGGQIEQKFLLAASGGNPPDVIGLFDQNTLNFSERGALLPLDHLMERDGLKRADYLPRVYNMGVHRGITWGLPSVPACLALHYNKRLFREAGLDPGRPPQTLKELDEYAEKLTKRDASGKLVQLGFSPSDPGWWNPLWPTWFGGRIWDGVNRPTPVTPANIAAFEWAAGYPRKYGVKDLQAFRSAMTQFDTGQNSFISERVAMQLQGVYMFNFIEKYKPDLDYGVAPFPAADPSLTDVTLVQADLLGIPRGARHVQEAWEFIRYVQRQEVMEKLCLLQKRFSPLARTSEEFYEKHPNPNIRMFRRLAESPTGSEWPRTPMVNEYVDEMEAAYERIFLLRETPAEALARVAARMGPRFAQREEKWNALKDERLREWEANAPR